MISPDLIVAANDHLNSMDVNYLANGMHANLVSANEHITNLAQSSASMTIEEGEAWKLDVHIPQSAQKILRYVGIIGLLLYFIPLLIKIFDPKNRGLKGAVQQQGGWWALVTVALAGIAFFDFENTQTVINWLLYIAQFVWQLGVSVFGGSGAGGGSARVH